MPNILVRSSSDLERVDGLIIPGGESTTMGKLLKTYGVGPVLTQRIRDGMPVFGTCAGLILLSNPVDGRNENRLGVVDIDVERNAYGRQVDSFEADLSVPVLGEETFRGVFIRAPIIRRLGTGIEVLARFESNPVLVRAGTILGASFHPELTDDTRVHRYFVSLLEESLAQRGAEHRRTQSARA